MRIEVKKDFKHGTDAFLAEEVRVVSDELGQYFIEQGWAAEFGKAPMPASTEPVTLSINKSAHKAKDSNG